MSIFKRLANWFSRGGRDDNRLQVGMDHAHAKRPAEAIAVYDAIVNAKGGSSSLRARALFNRALAHSSLKNDQQAILDLEEVVSFQGTPENVRSAARNQLVRVRNRVQRRNDHPKA